MSPKTSLLLFALGSAALVGASLEAADSPRVELGASVEAFVGKYCLECHDAATEKGDLNLEDLSIVLDTPNAAQHWQDVLDVLNLGEMPPEGKSKPVLQPSKEEMTRILEDLTNSLVDARKAMADTGGRLVSRRLNQREYVRFVGDLLGVDVDANLLPDDDTFEGFDTVGATQFLTGFHIDRYLNAAKDALDKLRPELAEEPVARMDLKNRTGAERIREEYEKAKALYESGEIAHPDLDEETYRRLSPTQRRTHKQRYLNAKNLQMNFSGFDEGAIVIDPRAGFTVTVDMKDKPGGRYVLRARMAAAGKHQDKGRYVGLQRKSDTEDPLNGSMSYFHVAGTMEEPKVLEIPFETHGYQTSFHLRCRQREKPQEAEFEDYMAPFMKQRKITWYEEGIWVDWIEVVGPITPNVNRYEDVFFRGAEPTEADAEAYAEAIVERFAERAFRGRTPEASDIEHAMKFYRMAKASSRDFESSVKEALAYLMISPRFLFAIEDGGEKIASLNARALANRLALFLWSSPPDETLLAAAENDLLLEEKVLAAQVDRMLEDPRAEVFYRHFMDQWLGLHEIESVAFPDEYKDETLEWAKAEPIETYKHLVRENLSLRNLIHADFVVVNSLLAEFYGLEGVVGSEFRPVKVPASSVRGGLLGMTGILGMGGDGEKSLPIKRGAFVAAKIIDRHPPAPPPNVPLIKVDGRQSTRNLFEAHSAKPACASCHQRFDSFGFALESFDELGRWRDTETLKWNTVVQKDGTEKMVKLKNPMEVPIQTHGVLEDGETEFANYQEMVRLLADQRGEQFAGGMVGALIKYGIGRPVSFTDKDLIDQLIAESAANDFRARDLIQAFVRSRAFRSK